MKSYRASCPEDAPFLALRADLLHDVGHQRAQEHTDDARRDGGKQGVLDGVHRAAGLEDLDILRGGKVFKLERQTIRLDEGDQDDHDQRHQHDQYQRQNGHQEQRNLCAAQLDQRRAHALALDDIVVAGGQNLLLQNKRQRNDNNQHDGQRGALTDTLEAAARVVNDGVNARGQRVDALCIAQNRRYTEVRQRSGQNAVVISLLRQLSTTTSSLR